MKSERMMLSLSPDERRILEEVATRKGVSLAAVIRAGIALMSDNDCGKRYTSRTPAGRE